MDRDTIDTKNTEAEYILLLSIAFHKVNRFLITWFNARKTSATVRMVGYSYSPPEVDRIWLEYNRIPIYPIFYLLKGDYSIPL